MPLLVAALPPPPASAVGSSDAGGAHLVERARAALGAMGGGENGDLVLAGVAAIGDVTVVRFRETRFGLPVVGRGASMSSRPGADRLFSLRAPPFPRREVVVSCVDAARRASAALGWSLDPSRAHLAYLPDGTLVHRVPATVPETTPARPVVVLDASDGRVVMIFDAARHAGDTLAHRTNPIASPALERLPLPLLDAASATLDGPLLRARSCLDRGSTRRIGAVTVHVCDVDADARADENGDFLVAPPADGATASAFGETQAFFHAATAARFFRDELALPDGLVPPVTVVADVRMPPGWTAGDMTLLGCATCALEPLPNAFYVPDDPASPSTTDTLLGVAGDAIWLGLGTKRSFAVDGDIVHHEWAHAVIHHTMGSSSAPRLDGEGISFAPGASIEALADYFSAAISGDAKVGEWASGEAHPGEGTLRDLDGDARCPDALVGEVHGDARVLAQALFRVRRARDARVFDRAIIAALLAAPSAELASEELAEIILASLAPNDAAALRSELTTRGLLPRCTRVLDAETPRKAELGRGFVAPGRRATGLASAVPPIVQFRRAVPEDAVSATITLRLVEGANDPVALSAAVRFGAPVAYAVDGAHTGEEPVTNVSFERSQAQLRAKLTVPSTRTGYPLHLAVESDALLDARYDDVTIVFETAPPSVAQTDGGCGCTTVKTTVLPSSFLWLGLAAWAGRRRRG